LLELLPKCDILIAAREPPDPAPAMFALVLVASGAAWSDSFVGQDSVLMATRSKFTECAFACGAWMLPRAISFVEGKTAKGAARGGSEIAFLSP
jgi:hypothetical protein